MPTYEYECQKCHRRFDLLQPITEKPIDKCRFCNGKVKRLISAGGGIIFKGSGFYATDYKKSPSASKSDAKESSCPAKKDGCCPGCSKKD